MTNDTPNVPPVWDLVADIDAVLGWIDYVDHRHDCARVVVGGECDCGLAKILGAYDNLRTLRDKVLADAETHQSEMAFDLEHTPIEVVLEKADKAGACERALLTFIRTGQ